MLDFDKNRFVVATSNKLIRYDDIISVLKKEKQYKTLSLFLAQKEGVQILPSALFLGLNIPLLEFIHKHWGNPVMIRMDYSLLPQKKFLGGVPVFSVKKLEVLSIFLLGNGFSPLIHSDLNRFNTLYSVGLSIDLNNFTIVAEILGEGFDASDLRLGSSIPHEIIRFNSLFFDIESRIVTSEDQYNISTSERLLKINKLKAYTDYVNNSGKLLCSLDLLDIKGVSMQKAELPKNYKKISPRILKSLMEIGLCIKQNVISNLPYSNIFVASLSYLPDTGWILWDIYGNWYRR